MSHLEVDLDRHRLSLPGITTAFKSSHKQHGIHSLLTALLLPGIVFQPQQKTNDEDEPTSQLNDELNADSENTSDTIDDEITTIQAPFQKRSISKDSGFSFTDQVMHNLEINVLPQPSNPMERRSTFSKTDSTKSLPIVNPPLLDDSKVIQQQSNRKKALLERSQTRPELRKQESARFQKLLIEAMLIIHEAENMNANLPQYE